MSVWNRHPKDHKEYTEDLFRALRQVAKKVPSTRLAYILSVPVQTRYDTVVGLVLRTTLLGTAIWDRSPVGKDILDAVLRCRACLQTGVSFDVDSQTWDAARPEKHPGRLPGSTLLFKDAKGSVADVRNRLMLTAGVYPTPSWPREQRQWHLWHGRRSRMAWVQAVWTLALPG